MRNNLKNRWFNNLKYKNKDRNCFKNKIHFIIIILWEYFLVSGESTLIINKIKDKFWEDFN